MRIIHVWILFIYFGMSGCASVTYQKPLQESTKRTSPKSYCHQNTYYDRIIYGDPKKIRDLALKQADINLIDRCDEEQLSQYPLVIVSMSLSRIPAEYDGYFILATLPSILTLGILPGFNSDIHDLSLRDAKTEEIYYSQSYQIYAASSVLLIPVYELLKEKNTPLNLNYRPAYITPSPELMFQLLPR